jgi:hypothetical protein
VIKQILSSACLVALLAGEPGMSLAQNPQAGPPLRVQWSADGPRDGMQAVCGRVFNDGSLAAWHVVLLVEGLDGTDRVTHSRQVEVLGDVPSAGYAFFCVPEPAEARTYRVQVIGADWMTTAGE